MGQTTAEKRYLPEISYETFFRRHTGKDFVSLASTPNEEDCSQAGSPRDIQVTECTAYINQLERMYGPPPEGCQFCLIRNPHEFGTYYEAGLIYTDTDEDEEVEADIEYLQREAAGIPHPEVDPLQAKQEAMWDYINKLEHGADKWDDEGLAELYKAEHPKHFTKIIQLKIA